MKFNDIILAALAVTSGASALSMPDVQVDEPTAHELEARSQSETIKKIWNLENAQIAVAYAGTFAGLATGIAQIISSFKSGNSGCTVKVEVVKVDSRAVDTTFFNSTIYNLTSITESLVQDGYDINPFFWSTNETMIQYIGALSNNVTSIDNLSLSEDGLKFNVEALTDASTNSSISTLSARTTTLQKNKIDVHYHASGKCYTTHTKSEIATGIKKIMLRINYYDYYASCWALRFGSGSWHGHLKLLGMWSDDTVSSTGLNKACNANS